MIKYNNNSINDWYFDTSDIVKVYRNNAVRYQKIYSGRAATPKWIATYEGGVTSSAECDSTSAITRNEITLTNLIDVVIGNCVTTIGNSAFSYCSSLTSLTIHDSVTSISNNAFRNCSSLTSITVNSTTPPTLSNSNIFISTNDCPIYVPAESVNAYKTAENWSTYASRIQAIQ